MVLLNWPGNAGLNTTHLCSDKVDSDKISVKNNLTRAEVVEEGAN